MTHGGFMFSGGPGATDGGSADRRAIDAHALDDSPSGPNRNRHSLFGSTLSAPLRVRPTRVGNRRRPVQPAGAPAVPPVGSELAPASEALAVAFATPIRREQWVGKFQAGLVAIDLAAAAVAVALGYMIRFGLPGTGANPDLYLAVGVALPIAWMSMIGLNRAYEGRFVGAGAAEFQRIFRAFLHLTALVAFVSFATGADLSRGFLMLALPLALGFDLVGRYAARKYLHYKRSTGHAVRSVLAVGDAEGVTRFTSLLQRDQYAGLSVVGACVAEPIDDAIAGQLDHMGVPLLGDVDSIIDSARFIGADTVAVVSSARIGPEKLRWISWQLEGTDIHLVVAPGLIEVAGPRLHIQPVAGLPLLHVEQPQFTGFRRLLKTVFDRTVAGVSVLLMSPLLLGLGLTVRLSSRGPAFFRQIRVGRDGETFTMLKFRSMYVSAEDRLADLHSQNENSDGLLFKMRDDPRVTPIGKFLRKFSLDELPQLVNVMTGSMSLVGPRPPLPSEVARYGDDVRRRLLVKPGLTGLWQVSGRSDLSWDESVRLDLRYVENWSPALDLMILWKTAFAVLGRSGAY